MSHTVQNPNPPFTAFEGAIEVHQVPAASDNLCWILVCTATREAAVVDGLSAKEVMAYLEGRDIRWTTILNTHTHGDHIGINADLKRRGTGVLYRRPRVVRNTCLDARRRSRRGRGAGRQGRGPLMVTEGHLNGHVSYVFGDVLFCGDIIHRWVWAFLDGPPERMFDSLMRLAALPEETKVCCAHEYTQDNQVGLVTEPGNARLQSRIKEVWAIRQDGGCAVPSTIGIERATNPFLRPGSPALRRQLGIHMPTHPLTSFPEVFAATRAWKDQNRIANQRCGATRLVTTAYRSRCGFRAYHAHRSRWPIDLPNIPHLVSLHYAACLG